MLPKAGNQPQAGHESKSRKPVPPLAQKWGNSLAVRLPAAAIEKRHLNEGNEIEITTVDEKHSGINRKLDPETMLIRLRCFRASYLPGFDPIRMRQISVGFIDMNVTMR